MHTIADVLALVSFPRIRAVTRGNFPNSRFVYIASRTDNIETHFNCIVSGRDSVANNEHPKVQDEAVSRLPPSGNGLSLITPLACRAR